MAVFCESICTNLHHNERRFGSSGSTSMQFSSDRNHFLQLLINPAPRYRIARHLLMWTTVILVIYRGESYISPGSSDPTARSLYITSATIVYALLVFLIYLTIAKLIHRFILLRFQFFWLILGFVAVHLVVSVILYYQLSLFLSYFSLSDLPQFYTAQARRFPTFSVWQAPFDYFIVGIMSYSLVYSYVLYPLFLKIVKDLFTIKAKENQLEKEKILAESREAQLQKDKLQLEFDFLKAQISPHFLFNTLNNIYSFSIKSPDKVPDTILRLANLMRYTIYETKSDFVPLNKEIEFLNSYMQLQRIRHEADSNLTYSVTGESEGRTIAPLMLIVFVENAFKHGLEASARAGWIRTNLSIVRGTLWLEVSNSTSSAQKKKGVAGGIGLNNVRKRLELLYPGRYRLDIVSQTHEFRVNLTIDL
ncbi:sensor histidine kinase [Salmonirosea aquatica]